MRNKPRLSKIYKIIDSTLQKSQGHEKQGNLRKHPRWDPGLDTETWKGHQWTNLSSRTKFYTFVTIICCTKVNFFVLIHHLWSCKILTWGEKARWRVYETSCTTFVTSVYLKLSHSLKRSKRQNLTDQSKVVSFTMHEVQAHFRTKGCSCPELVATPWLLYSREDPSQKQIGKGPEVLGRTESHRIKVFFIYSELIISQALCQVL